MTADVPFLRSFHVVCGTRTFAEAADRLGITQPAVSYQMSRLEEVLGCRLFERSGRRAILTPEGLALRALCERFVPALDDLVARLRDGTAGRDQPLRIASVSGFGRYVLFPLLRGEPFADLEIELLFRTAAEVFERVEGGLADLGLVYRPRVSRHLELRGIWREELVLIASAGAAPDPARIEELEARAWVTYEECDYVFGAWFERILGTQPGALESVAHFDELEEVVEMVRSGRGISIVPLDSVAGEGDEVRVLRRGRARCHNVVHVVQRAGGYERDEVRRVVDALDAAADRAGAAVEHRSVTGTT